MAKTDKESTIDKLPESKIAPRRIAKVMIVGVFAAFALFHYDGTNPSTTNRP